MTNPHPKSPGWYADPDILPGSATTLRYWTGRHWTERRRPMPVLTRFELGGLLGAPQPRALEGPAREAAELTAGTAEASATRDGGRSDTMERPTGAEVLGIDLPTSSGGGRGVPPVPPEVGGGGGDGGGGESSPDRRALTRRRRRWWILAGVAVLCAVLVTLAGVALEPSAPGPRVLTDARFLKQASSDCAQTLPNLRPPDGGDFGTPVTPAQAATQIRQAATGLDKLADQLAQIPASAHDQPYITNWLNEWHRYDVLGRQFAAYIVQHGTSGKAPPVLAESAGVAQEIDNFAASNDLGTCNFSYNYSASPSDF